MREPIKISEEAWKVLGNTCECEDCNKVRMRAQRVIDSALAEKDKEIAELKELNSGIPHVYKRLMKIQPWCESNDMNWEDEMDCGFDMLEESVVEKDLKITQLEKQVLALREVLSKALSKIEAANFLLGDKWAAVDEIKASLNSLPTDISKQFVKREALEKSLPIVEFVVARNPNWIEATETLVVVRKELES